MSFPILLIADCSIAPPDDLIERFISKNLLDFLKSHPVVNWKVFLWSRLILTSLPLQLDPEGKRRFEYIEDYSFSPRIKGDLFSYSCIDSTENQLALVLSKLPVSVSVINMNWTKEAIEKRRESIPGEFNAWINRQDNPTYAFYQYLTAEANIHQRKHPMIRLSVSGEDVLDVTSPAIYIQESLFFWAHDFLLCSVLGTVLPPILTEERTADKTIGLLRSLPV